MLPHSQLPRFGFAKLLLVLAQAFSFLQYLPHASFLRPVPGQRKREEDNESRIRN
jgi:hypothetical protein